MYEIVKHIDFCFGHRLMDYEGKCNQPHGHNGRAEIRLQADSLDDLGMVADFRDVRRTVEAWINANLDHRMILRRGDPLIEAIEGLGQRAYVMDENPTTENMARMLFQEVRQLGLPVVGVDSVGRRRTPTPPMRPSRRARRGQTARHALR